MNFHRNLQISLWNIITQIVTLLLYSSKNCVCVYDFTGFAIHIHNGQNADDKMCYDCISIHTHTLCYSLCSQINISLTHKMMCLCSTHTSTYKIVQCTHTRTHNTSNRHLFNEMVAAVVTATTTAMASSP